MNKAVLLTITLVLSILTYGQNITSPEKKTEKSETTLEEPKIVTFPIKSKKTTDPYYEQNKAKSEATQKRLDAPKVEIVKDDKYYQDKIAELKRRIKEIEDNPNDPNINHNKLGGLTEKLIQTEQEYSNYKNNQ